MEGYSFTFTHNLEAAWEQEQRLARDYYTWACSLPIHYPSNVQRWRDARERLDRATYRIPYEQVG